MSLIKFWLLDINYEIVDDVPEIRLWGIDDQGKRVLVIDRNFVPYFYLQLKADANPEEVAREVLAQKSSLPSILNVETVDMKFFGKSVKSLKVNIKSPDIATKYAAILAKLPKISDHLEDDIRYSSQYLICNNVTPCGWHEVQVERAKEKLNTQVDEVYFAKTTPKTVVEVTPPKLRILAFSVVCYSKVGAPKADRSPVVLISVATNTCEFKQLVAKDSDDKPVLQAFINLIQDFDPDVIVGYGTNRQDWPYLIERCKYLDIPILVGRTETGPHTSVYGHVSITGRANVDLYDFAEDITEVKVKTLANIADFIGVMDSKKRTLIEEVEIPAYWDDPKKRPMLMKFSKENTQSIMGISGIMLDFAIQLASLIRFPLDYAGTAAVGFRVEGYLIHQAHTFGELIPRRVEQPYFPYKGAVVLEPKPGIHEKVAILDFKCHPAGTLILTKQGLMPIEMVRPGDYVLGHQGWVRVREVHNYPYSGGLIKVNAEGGRELLSTPNHRLLVWNRGLREVKAEDVSVGHKLIETVDIPMIDVEGKTSERDLAMAELLGLLYAEGYVLKRDAPYFSKERGKVRVSHQHRVTITISRDEATLHHELNRLVYLLWNERANWIDEKNKGRSTLLLQKNHIWEEINEAIQKLVPFLLRNRQLIKAFLKGFFEGDGYVNSTRKSVVLPQSEKNVSKLQLVEYLLKILGIKATTSPRLGVTSDGKKYYKRYLEIIGRQDLESFRDKVGFISNRKNNQLAACLNSPVRSNFLLSVPSGNQKSGIRVTLRHIKAVKRVRYQGFVYDLTVGDENSPYYFANFLLTHNSMYPNVMIMNNVSPDTYIGPKEPTPPSGVNVAPEVGHRFRKEPPGFYKQVLSSLISVRDDIRKRMKILPPKSMEYRVLDARQKAIKVITNACYGYAGWIGARWYLKPVAEATTAWGRRVILNTVELAKNLDLEVIYGDTDSVFVKYDPKKIEELSRAINNQFGLEVKPDEIYVRILFTEAKKRYCGLLPDGRLDVVGLEVVRGDWAAVAKDIQERIIEIILKGQLPSDAVEVAREYIANLREKKFPYHDLIIWKTLTMPLEDYKVRAPHVEAAKILMKAGWKLTLGDKIGYVVTKGVGKLYDKVKPYTLATYDDVDLDYYVTNQVVPAVLRILGMFNVTEEDILTEAKPKSLNDFTKAKK